jgi:hypothetical protein
MTESSSSRSISPGAWIRFIAPYYFINTITLLSYIPIRMKWTSDTLVESKENILNMSLVSRQMDTPFYLSFLLYTNPI